MPEFLDPRDRRLLIGAGIATVLLLALTYAVAPTAPQQSIGYPSSYSSEWAGAKAAFLLLKESGYGVERWEKSPEELPAPSQHVVLVLAEPSDAGTPSERTAIRRFVQGGGRVLVTGASGAEVAPDAKAVAVPDWNLKPKTFSALAPSPLSRNAPEIAMVAPDDWASDQPAQVAVYGKEGKPVVVSYKVGNGEVIWWAASSPFSNGSIRESGNLALFLNSIGPPSESRVLWDEYFHGARGSLLSFFLETPLPWAGVQLGIVFLAAVFTLSRRWGPLWVPVSDSRLSPLEFVDTLGDLYKSGHASPAAVGVAYQRLRSLLARKLETPAKSKLPELCRAASRRFGWPEDALLDTLARSERAMRSLKLDEGEALELVRNLHDYSDRLAPYIPPGQEKPAWK
jgi:hypothetical protein